LRASQGEGKKLLTAEWRGGKAAEDAEKIISPQRTLRGTEEFWLMAVT